MKRCSEKRLGLAVYRMNAPDAIVCCHCPESRRPFRILTMAMHFLYGWMVCAMPPVEGAPVVDEVDAIQVHHMLDEQGRHIFSELIFWEKVEGVGLCVVDWRLLKPGRTKPVFNSSRKQWVARFLEGGIEREIRGDRYWETMSANDPELENREVWPTKRRRELSASRRGRRR